VSGVTKLLTDVAVSRNRVLLLASALISVLMCLAVFKAVASVDTLTSVYLEAKDNRAWVVAQLVVEYQRLELAVIQAERAGATAEALDDVILRLQIYHSRLAVLAGALKQTEFTENLDPLLSSLQLTADRISGLLDGYRALNVPGLAEIEDILRSDGAVVRKVPSLALEVFSKQAEDSRTIFNLALKQSILVIIGLFVALIGTMGLLYFALIKLQIRERTLNRLSANLRTTLDASPDATIITDLAGGVTGMNAAGLAMFGLTEKTLAGVGLSDLVQHDEKVHSAADSAGQPPYALPLLPIGEHGHMRARQMNGPWFPADVTSSLGEFADGQQMGIYFVRDLTEQDAAEVELRAARDQARMDASTKDRFIAVMSHEMRTPLTGVIAALDLLDAESDPDERSFLIRTARSCSITSLEQIEDVLELARIGSDTETAQLMDPVVIAREVADQMKPLAARRGNQIKINADRLPEALKLCGLPQTYRRVLSNLVGNSVKFTQDGLIRIEIAMTDLAGADVLLRTTVQDNGVGISPADQGRIFDEFEVAHDTKDSTPPGGSGLGLAIVKSGVQRMGGTIMLDSTPNQGSTFWFEIKLTGFQAKPPPAAVPNPVFLPFRKRQFLVVDDNIVNRILLSRMVVRLGHEVDVADDGPTAVSMAAVKRFDLILMDINLPGIDGLEATRQIRIAGASKSAAIIGLTAQILAQHRARMKPAGMDRLIAKPITLNQLALYLDECPTTEVPQLVADKPDDKTELHALLGDDLLKRLLLSCVGDITLALSCWPVSALDPVTEVFCRYLHNALGSAAVLCEACLHTVLSQAEQAANNGDLELLISLRQMTADQMNAVRQGIPANPPLDDVSTEPGL
jgi:PAS domain S-box-containing protein